MTPLLLTVRLENATVLQFVCYRKDHIEREKASVEHWERNWKFMATNYRDVNIVLLLIN